MWRRYGRAEVDLFASEETTHCPLWFPHTSSSSGVGCYGAGMAVAMPVLLSPDSSDLESSSKGSPRSSSPSSCSSISNSSNSYSITSNSIIIINSSSNNNNNSENENENSVKENNNNENGSSTNISAAQRISSHPAIISSLLRSNHKCLDLLQAPPPPVPPLIIAQLSLPSLRPLTGKTNHQLAACHHLLRLLYHYRLASI
ncbi:hypothetical protein PO909_016919 [Leuciscus waleckii]